MAAVTRVSRRHGEGRTCFDKELAGARPRKRPCGRRNGRPATRSSRACVPMPAVRRPAERIREGRRGTALHPARPARTPHAGSSGKPLPGPLPALRPPPRNRNPPALPAFPGQLPIPRRRRSPGSRRSARSEARTNDLDARQDDGHTRPRGRPRRKLIRPLDAKRLRYALRPAYGQISAPRRRAGRSECMYGRLRTQTMPN
jgi:hypothetical protein